VHTERLSVHFISRPYLINVLAIGTVVVRPSVRLFVCRSQMYCG